MKTDAIQQLIRISKVAYDEDVSAAASAELAALEADNAAMREKTLNELDRLIGEAFENPHTVSTIGSSVAAIGLKIARAVVHRALTPDSGKVLVDVDKIREREWSFVIIDGKDMWMCAACGNAFYEDSVRYHGSPSHPEACWIYEVLKARP